MNVILNCVLIFSVVVQPYIPIQKPYFPEHVFSTNRADDQYLSSHYSEYLKALREPSLYQESKTQMDESYRFLWLRTFHHPVAVRLIVNRDGTSTITTKVSSGTGGHSAGHLTVTRSAHLTKQSTDSFLKQIETLGFWQLAAHEQPLVGGPDGAQWVIEGTKHKKYHLAARWSPKDGAVRTLALALAVDLGRLKIPASELY